MNTRKIAWGVAAGLVVGSAVAALFGTKKGAELRKKIAEYSSQYTGEVVTALTGIVGSLYSTSESKEETEHSLNFENKKGNTPEKEGKEKWASASNSSSKKW